MYFLFVPLIERPSEIIGPLAFVMHCVCRKRGSLSLKTALICKVGCLNELSADVIATEDPTTATELQGHKRTLQAARLKYTQSFISISLEKQLRAHKDSDTTQIARHLLIRFIIARSRKIISVELAVLATLTPNNHKKRRRKQRKWAQSRPLTVVTSQPSMRKTGNWLKHS
jgi:hypothetical protein